jgi:hypothetical protein
MGSELMSLAGRVTQGVIDNSRRRREWMRMRLLPVDDMRDFHPTGFQKIRDQPMMSLISAGAFRPAPENVYSGFCVPPGRR